MNVECSQPTIFVFQLFSLWQCIERERAREKCGACVELKDGGQIKYEMPEILAEIFFVIIKLSSMMCEMCKLRFFWKFERIFWCFFLFICSSFHLFIGFGFVYFIEFDSKPMRNEHSILEWYRTAPRECRECLWLRNYYYYYYD